jgi:hypothetical protein
MKFVNVITKHTQSHIDEILFNMTLEEVSYIEYVYSMFDFVEYTNDDKKECMFCVIDDYSLSKLKECYEKFNITYQFEDLTKEVFFDVRFKTTFKNQYGFSAKDKIQKLMKTFKNDYTTADIVLDKILEKGVDSLTKFDLSVLQKV